MKTITILFLVFVFISFIDINAQEEELSSPVSIGVDFYSSYVWRGVNYGGPSLQPYVEFTSGGFSIGAWGSQSYDGGQEMDLYFSYELEGLSFVFTDYYYPGTKYFDLTDTTGAHGMELNLGYGIGDISLSGNYILNQAGGAGTVGGDKYFEIGYSIGDVDLFVGAGDGWHTSNGKFGVCNVGLSAGKELKLTESFSIPTNGSVILNPETEQFYIVVGFSF